MSWRDTLNQDQPKAKGATQNTHNAQNSAERGGSANNAYCADSRSTLIEALNETCASLKFVTASQVFDALSQQEKELWQLGKEPLESFQAFAHMLELRRTLDKGIRPEGFHHQAQCANCGPVWLWVNAQVAGCPWCHNRVTGYPIPRPHQVSCKECVNYTLSDHPHLGRCKHKELNNTGGIWDTEKRDCTLFIPAPNRQKQ